MDVRFGDYGDCNDVGACVCCSSYMADSWVFPLFAVRIDVPLALNPHLMFFSF